MKYKHGIDEIKQLKNCAVCHIYFEMECIEDAENLRIFLQWQGKILHSHLFETASCPQIIKCQQVPQLLFFLNKKKVI